MQNENIPDIIYPLPFVFLLVACNRRELTYSPEATITISADWSQSGLNEKEQDYGATAIFYPTDGSTPFVALMGDRTYKTLCLKEGCYNVVLFNRSFDDFGNLCFRGEENYQTLEAYVKKMEIRNESSSERIIMESPDELAADYIEGFEVTSDMPETIHQPSPNKVTEIPPGTKIVVTYASPPKN